MKMTTPIRRYFSLILIIISTAILSPSCRKVVEIDSVEKQLFLDEHIIGCYKDGHEFFVYNEKIHQMAINPIRHTVRLQDDTQSEYCHIRLESYPRSIGITILADLYVGENDGQSSYKLIFECSKVEDGKIWLWNKENKIGTIIPEH
ncbi:MAG: hypothetical protein J6U80_03140 [Bacteroidales bacterium]|nr:hypothetical protein [Bacteroidales bacterium]